MESKEVCAEDCKALFGWQVAAGALPDFHEVKQVEQVEHNGRKVCSQDQGPLIYEDGVIYCGKCQSIYMRLKDRDSVDEVGYLLKRDWSLRQIADMLSLCEDHTVRLARQSGVSFGRHVKRSEKLRIAEYMLMHGAGRAAVKFELHQETVNRYARELGLGTQQRYNRLKVKALVLFATGEAIAKVAKKLGVHWRTAKNWKNQMLN
jgi:AraC-like DNA-binding protein